MATLWGFKPSGALTWGWFNDGTVWNSVEKKYASYTTDENGVKNYIEPEWYYLAPMVPRRSVGTRSRASGTTSALGAVP